MKDSTFKKYCLMIDYWFTNSRNGVKSYQKFYPESSYETADANFRKILENTRVKDYIKEKECNKSNELNITLDKQLLRLNNIIDSDCKETDKINAIKEQNKLLALYEEHNRQKKSDLITDKVSINFKNKR